jgi:membrane protein implicated in regulation of membrane protease activity
MLYIYLASLLLGGSLVLGSLVMGGDDGDMHHDISAESWLPIASLRFWTLLLFVFGLTGTLLSLTEPESTLTPWLSGGTALVGASLATAALKRLARREVSSGVTTRDFVGASGRVLLPIEPGRPGKVRVSLKGQSHDLPAIVDGDGTFQVREEVMILEVKDEIARVSAVVSPRS